MAALAEKSNLKQCTALLGHGERHEVRFVDRCSQPHLRKSSFGAIRVVDGPHKRRDSKDWARLGGQFESDFSTGSDKELASN
jgi:hypothetical protein